MGGHRQTWIELSDAVAQALASSARQRQRAVELRSTQIEASARFLGPAVEPKAPTLAPAATRGSVCVALPAPPPSSRGANVF
jgi:hypothetical protein